MKDTSDVLTVSFCSGLKDESALCITRKSKGKTIMLKMELGEQADILYRLLTEQMTKAEIKEERYKDCFQPKSNENTCSLQLDHNEEITKAFQLGLSFGFIDGLKTNNTQESEVEKNVET